MNAKEKDIKIMINKGKFLDIYNKYGKREYNEKICEIIYKDIYNETNNKFLALQKTAKYFITKKLAVKLLRAALISATATSAVILGVSEKIIDENRIKYEQEIDKYDNHIQEYAEQIKKLNLNDFETIMKVMYDEWNYIGGYGPAKMDEMGYYRLAFTEPNQAGVCRNIADDVTAKLNAINPEFDAKNMIVYMNGEQWEFSDIDLRYAKDYVPNNNENKELVLKSLGNHLITIIKIPKTNIILTVDPTNPGIGTLKNGVIYTFSTPDGKGLSKPLFGNIIYGIPHYLDIKTAIIESFIPCDQSVDELREKYGIEEQNKILEKIKTL